MKTTVRRPSLRELRAEMDEGVLRLALMVWPELHFISDERRQEPYYHRDLNRSKYTQHQGTRERLRRAMDREDWAGMRELLAPVQEMEAAA